MEGVAATRSAFREEDGTKDRGAIPGPTYRPGGHPMTTTPEITYCESIADGRRTVTMEPIPCGDQALNDAGEALTRNGRPTCARHGGEATR